MNRHYEGLARRLACAYISYQMGTTYQTAERNFKTNGEELGEYWYMAAERMAKEVSESQGELLRGKRTDLM